MLCWFILWWCGNDDIMHHNAWTGRKYIVYESLPQLNTYTTQDVKPNIIDAPLMLSFRMGQWLCHFLFYL